MLLGDANEICSRLFRRGSTKTFKCEQVVENIEYLMNQGMIENISYDTEKPLVLTINPKVGFELHVIAEIMCWRPQEVTWECKTETGEFTVSSPIRSVRDMRRPKNNMEEIQAKYEKIQESGEGDAGSLENMERDGLFVRIEWK